MAPAVLELTERFESQHSVKVDVHSGGSSRGLNDVRSGVAHIGMVSRALTAAEQDLVGTVIAQDGIAFIVNANNSITGLEKGQVLNLYQKRWRTWSALRFRLGCTCDLRRRTTPRSNTLARKGLKRPP
jgi:phosphate transport system substrate-binding protein